MSAKSEYYQKNKEKILARSNRRSREKKDLISIQKRIYYINRRDELLAAAKSWNAAHPEARKRNNASWTKANPESARTQVRNRAARIRNAEGKHTVSDVREILKMQRGKCAYSWCRKSISKKYHVDHIKPLASRGSNDRKNLQLLCRECNQKKNAKDPIDFVRQNGLLI